MKHLILLLALVCLSGPVMAQEAEKADDVVSSAATPPTSDADEKERLALAEKMHEIWPIRIRMENAIENVAEQVPEERRAEVKAIMRKSMNYNALEEESIKAMVKIFTVDELKAMIDFYGSDVGRSISSKTSVYETTLQPAVSSMMDKALLDLRTGNPDNPVGLPQSTPVTP